MNERELRKALGRVQPSEALIRKTLNRIEEKRREERPVYRVPAYGFTRRLAGAMCALVLLVGLGIAGLQGNPDLLPHAVREGDPTVVQQPVSEVVPGTGAWEATMAALVAEAESSADAYAVVRGFLEGCYFAEVSEAEAAAGVLYRCVLAVRVDEITAQTAALTEGVQLQVEYLLYGEEALQALLNTVASPAGLWLVPGEAGIWQMKDLLPL